jgi:hypothetical protein
VRLHDDGRYERTCCGAPLDIPLDAKTESTISAASGRPTVRVLRIGRVEVHRCEQPEDE